MIKLHNGWKLDLGLKTVIKICIMFDMGGINLGFTARVGIPIYLVTLNSRTWCKSMAWFGHRKAI